MALAIEIDPPPLETDDGGILRVGGTRVPVDAVIGAWNEGASAEEITALYPALRLADVYDSIAYYLRHRESLDEYLEEQEQARKAVREEARRRFDTSSLRAELVARLQSQG